VATPAVEVFIVLVLGNVVTCCWPGIMRTGGLDGRLSVIRMRLMVGPLVTVTVLLYCEAGSVMEMTSPSSTHKKSEHRNSERKKNERMWMFSISTSMAAQKKGEVKPVSCLA
jgi:hypothetical protein